MRKIHDLQDTRDAAALLTYLKHEDRQYRVEAALAFASVQDSSVLKELALLLDDPEKDVRAAAAYSIGQLKTTIIELTLINYIDKEKDPAVKMTLLEALGKCASPRGLAALSSYRELDCISKIGQAWGLYRAGLKGLWSEAAGKAAIRLLGDTCGKKVRLGAAHYLARTKDIDLDPFFNALSEIIRNEPDDEVRMALAAAMSHISLPQKTAILKRFLTGDTDPNVKINAIRALKPSDYPRVRAQIREALNDPSENVAVAAADYLLSADIDPAEAMKMGKSNSRWRVRSKLFEIALKSAPDKKDIREFLGSTYDASTHVYEKAHLLKAMHHDFVTYAFLEHATFSAQSPVIRSYGMDALANMRRKPGFPDLLVPIFNEILVRAFRSTDQAVLAIAADLVADPDPDLAFETHTSLIMAARDSLSLPRDIETYIALQKAIDHLTDAPPGKRPENPYNHPIDWDLVRRIPAGQQAVIRTNKGAIVLELFPEEAPATTANFVDLVQRGYYQGKNFHRVVPNFVAQGGCPRGDGWGSEDYSIRSEFGPLNYGAGYVGMASAGKDTESCQWFITHSPTPHLDGRYSIFARVVEGMDVVGALGIGDKIESVFLDPALQESL